MRWTYWMRTGSGLQGSRSWRILGSLKEMNPQAPVVSGGGLATAGSDLLFRSAPVDIVVVGEGEVTMKELCRALARGRDIRSVAGIGFRQDGKVDYSPPRKNIEDLDEAPFPAWDLLPMEIYLRNPIWGDVAHNSSGFRTDVRVTRSMNIIAGRGGVPLPAPTATTSSAAPNTGFAARKTSFRRWKPW